MLQAADIAVSVVDTEVRTEEHTLNWCDVNICIGKDTPLLQTIVLIMVKLTHWVLAVAHTTYGTRESHAVNLIDRQCGRHFQRILQWCTIHAVRIREGCIFTYGDNTVDLI